MIYHNLSLREMCELLNPVCDLLFTNFFLYVYFLYTPIAIPHTPFYLL